MITSKIKKLVELFVLSSLVLSSTLVAQAQTAQLEEVIVTATKRAKNLQDVPISIGVVSGEFINKFDVKDLNDFQSYVPGLQIQSTFGSWAVRVRGLGSGITNLAFDSSVPVFNDGVYCGRGKCLESAFLDVGRIEVARGPQGALFGKSTMAGAIGVISAKPTDEFEGNLKAGYEMEDGSYSLSGAVSGPISEGLNGRLAFKYDDGDGWVENPYAAHDEPQDEKYALRASFAWDSSESTTYNLKVETGNSATSGRSNQLVAPGLLSVLSSDPNPEFEADNVRRTSTGVGEEDYYDYDWSLASLTVDHQLGEHTLTGILGYWEYENAWRLDADGGPDSFLNTDLRDEYDQMTAELRFLSPTDQTVEYIVGAWYQKSDLKTQQFSPFRADFARFFAGVVLPPFLVPILGPPDSVGGVGMDRRFQRDQDAFSLYGQATWNVSDRFRLVADVRYTDETQDARGQSFASTFPDGVNPVAGPKRYIFQNEPYLFFQKREDDSIDPSLRAQFDLNDNTMLYAGWSTGSKAGGLKANDGTLGDILVATCADPVACQQAIGQSSVTPQDMVNGLTLSSGSAVFDFEDEEGESIELGAKMSLADGRANLNFALYTMDFDNLQTSSYDGTRFIIQNAASVSVEGFELEGTWQVNESLRLAAATAYVDATYDSFPGAQCIVNPDHNQRNPGCTDGEEDLAGERLERVPEWEANISADWTSQLTDNTLMLASLSMYYSGDYFVRQDFDPHGHQESVTKWDARVAVGSSDERWEVGLTGRNLSDEYTIQHAYEILGNEFQTLSRGRTITLDAVYRF